MSDQSDSREPASSRLGGLTVGIDALNISLARGTGIATYARGLADTLIAEGARTQFVFDRKVSADQAVRETAPFDAQIDASNLAAPDMESPRGWKRRVQTALDLIASGGGVTATEVEAGTVLREAYDDRLPTEASMVLAPGLSEMSEVIFRRFDRFARVKFSDPPDFFHWTTQVPAYCVGAKNLYTIHDLVPLRMPGSTLDDKDRYVRVHKAIAARADAILTVSDHSKRDIVEYLNAPAEKVSVIPPLVEPAPDILNEPEAEARQVLHSAYGLQWKEYFLYFGSIEPKKNLARQIEAYAGTGVRYPLVVVSALNWLSDDDFILLKPYLEDGASSPLQKSVRRLDYLPRKQIHRLMRGARSLLFASSYEGFGLPVAEAATYGTPSIAGRGHSMEYAGGTGAIYVDPFNVRDIRDAIKRMADDDTFVATLGARAMVESRRFCHDSHAKSLIALYSRLTP